LRHLLSAALLPALLLPACKDETRLTAVLPLSGEFANYGESIRKGVELAYEELREDGGAAHLDLQVVDSTGDPAQARELTRQGFEDGAVAVLGGVTAAEAAAMIEAAEAADRVLLSPSVTASALSEASRNFYRLAPSDVVSGNTMADFAFRRLKVATAVVVAESPLYARGVAQGFRPTFENLGGEVVAALVLGAADLSEALAQAVSHEPDAIYLAAGPATLSAAVAGLRGLGFEGRILTTQDLASPAVLRTTGGLAAGVLLTRSAFETNGDPQLVDRFVERFRQKYGEDPDVFAAQGYDALRVLAKATAGRPSDLPGEVRKGLRDAVKNFAGVTGTLEFNSQGEVTKYPRVYSVAENLTLRDHGKLLDEAAEKIQIEIEERRQALAALRAKMAESASE
jgi:branched-chain amino acid transport system substrate-binding protein